MLCATHGTCLLFIIDGRPVGVVPLPRARLVVLSVLQALLVHRELDCVGGRTSAQVIHARLEPLKGKS